MSEFLGPSTGKEFIGPSPLLRDVLAATTFKPGRAISPDIDSVDLGVFHEEARTLANETFLDDDNTAFSKMVYATLSGRILIPDNKFKGKDNLVGVMGLIPKISKKQAIIDKRMDIRYPSMVMHSFKNTDQSFSVLGLKLLMIEDSYQVAVPAVLLAGRTQNILLFRGENAPQLPEKEMNDKNEMWVSMLREQSDKYIKPGMSLEEFRALGERLEWGIMRAICAKYDLHSFTGPSDSPIVRKQTP